MPIVDIHAGSYVAAVSTDGGALARLTYNEWPLAESFTIVGEPPLSCGAVLAPWPNRVEDGKFTWAGEAYQLAITEPDRNNAIHGFALRREWSVDPTQTTNSSVTLTCTIGNEPGYPWLIDLVASYAVSDPGGLTATFTALYRGVRTSVFDTGPVVDHAPFAFGLHPYLSACGEPLDTSTLTVPVAGILPLTSDRLLPASQVRGIDSGDFDVSAGQRVGTRVLDNCYQRTMPTAILHGSRGGVAMHVSDNFHWWQIYTASQFPYPDGTALPPSDGDAITPHRAIAIEPMTTPPNGFATGTDVIALTPNVPFTATMTLTYVNNN